MGTFREELKDILKLDRATNKSSILAWAKKWFVQEDAKYLYEQIVSGHLDNLTEKDRLYKLNDYLYAINYDTIDYEVGNKFMKDYYLGGGACSSVRFGKYHGRNYDWKYDNQVEIVVRVSGNKNRYKSIGICSNTLEITKSAVENKEELGTYIAIPFKVVDGINEKGVCCNINVVPRGDKGITTGTHPTFSTSICSMMIPRYVLDNFATAKEAVEGLDKVNIWTPSSDKLNYELHVMISDPNETYIVEFIENTLVAHKVYGEEPTYPAIMTNFYVTDVTTDTNGLVTINRDGLDNESGITPNGSGLERHNVAANWVQSATEESDMLDLMSNKLKYTHTYTDEENIWYTELVGSPIAPDSEEVTTCSSPVEDYAFALSVSKDWYQHRDRNNPNTWQTVHTCVYDLENKSLVLINQENPDNKLTLYL